MAEKFALEQLARDRRAVDLDQRAVVARAALMDRARDQFLADPGLAEDQHGGIGRRDHFDLLEHAADAALEPRIGVPAASLTSSRR